MNSGISLRLATIGLAALAGLIMITALGGPSAAATPTCGTSTAPAGYTVTVCLTAPAAGATVAGVVPVTATVQVSAGAPSVNGVQFTLDGATELFAFQAPYSFNLHTYLSATGPHTLAAAAVLSGGYTSTPTSMALTFGSYPAPPPPVQFTPRAGSTPAAGQPLVVAAGGDGATGLTAESQVANLIAGWNPNLFLYLGDVYNAGTPEEFLNWWGENGSMFSRFASITDPTLGDHEYSIYRQAQTYMNYWGNPAHYYSVNSGGWHIISLDSNGEYGQRAATSAQYKWLANDLASNFQPCTLVEFADPVYSLNPNEASPDLSAYWQLLTSYHVPIVLNGHSHNYQRWQPMNGSGQVVSAGGTTEFVVGTTGQWISPFTGTDTRVAAGEDTTATAWGALQLDLNRSGASYRFENISGQTEDSGTIACNSMPNLMPPSTPTGVHATAVSGREIDLGWTASTDSVGVTGYQISRNGTLIATVPGYQTSYVDNSVAASTTYSYTVVAVDGAGNKSWPSAAASATTPAPAPAYVQSGVVATSTLMTSATVSLPGAVHAGDLLTGWFAQYNSAGQVGVSDNVNGAWTRVTGETFSSGTGDIALYYVPSSAAAPNGLTVTVSSTAATYLDGAVGEYYGTAVAGPLAADSIAAGNSATANSGNTASVPAGSLVFGSLITGGSPGTVTAGSSNGVPLVTRAANQSSAVVAADVLTAAAGPQQATFALGAATDWYAASAVFLPASTTDTSPPTIPTGVTATAVSSSTVNVGWTASTDDVSVAGYSVYRNGTLLGNTNGSTTSYVDSTAAASTTYSYTVVAFDPAGNRSAASSPATVTTPAVTPSYVQGGTTVSGSRVASATITLSAPVAAGNLLVGWFAQYDASGPVTVSDNVNGAWTRVAGETFGNGGGDIALFYKENSAAAPNGLTVTVGASTATWIEAVADDYASVATSGSLLASSLASGNSTAASTPATSAEPAGSLVFAAMVTGGGPGTVTPGSSGGVPLTARASSGSGAADSADVTASSAGTQQANFTLGSATDWYALCAVFQ